MLRKILFILIFVLTAEFSNAAVAKVGTTCTKNDGTTSPHTMSCALNGSANYAFAVVGNYQGVTITSVVWNGTTMSIIGSESSDSDGRLLSLFGLASPATGTLNLVVTYSGSCAGCSITLTGYSGVDTTTPTSGFQSGQAASPSGAVSPSSLTVTSATDDMVVDAIVITNSVALTVGSGQTEDANFNDVVFGSGRLGVSHEAGAASVAMTWTYAGTVEWAAAAVNLKASTGGGGATNSRSLLLGVGR